MDELTAAQVAERLGVELGTVYAYVSRGVLSRRVAADGRTSRYDADEVEALRQRSRPRSARRNSGAVDVTIGTTISEIGDGWIRYRGHDLLDLAGVVPFESVARILWAAEPDGATEGDTGSAGAAALAAAVRATRAMPAFPAWSRLAAGVAAAAPLLEGAPGGALLDVMVGSLADVGAPDGASSVAGRLWSKVSPLAATAARVATLDRCLSLLAEHELATSTLGARVAASTGAEPAACVLAALGVLSGPLHGGAAVLVQQRLIDGAAASEDDAGFGHVVHGRGDPRAVLLDDVMAIAPPGRRRVIEADLAAHRAAGAPPPNVDAGLGALGYAAAFPVGATAAVFAVARTAGWLAHAFEEADERPLRYRGRTVYRGTDSRGDSRGGVNRSS